MTGLPLTIANLLTAMQAGRPGGATLAGLFTDDADYTEPFTGQTRRLTGRESVIAAIAADWDYPLADMHIRVDRAQAAGDEVILDWTCLSPGLPGGKGCATNRTACATG